MPITLDEIQRRRFPGQMPQVRMGPRTPVNIVGPMPLPPGPGFTHVFNDSTGRPQVQVYEPDTRAYQQRLSDIGQLQAALTGQAGASQTALRQTAMHEAGEDRRQVGYLANELAKIREEGKLMQARAAQESQGQALEELLGQYEQIQQWSHSDLDSPSVRQSVLNAINKQALSDRQAGVNTLSQLLNQLAGDAPPNDDLLRLIGSSEETPMEIRVRAMTELQNRARAKAVEQQRLRVINRASQSGGAYPMY